MASRDDAKLNLLRAITGTNRGLGVDRDGRNAIEKSQVC